MTNALEAEHLWFSVRYTQHAVHNVAVRYVQWSEHSRVSEIHGYMTRTNTPAWQLQQRVCSPDRCTTRKMTRVSYLLSRLAEDNDTALSLSSSPWRWIRYVIALSAITPVVYHSITVWRSRIQFAVLYKYTRILTTLLIDNILKMKHYTVSHKRPPFNFSNNSIKN